MKKKIAHLISTNFYGGPEKQIVEHIKILNKKKYTGMVISFIENNSRNEILDHAERNAILSCGIATSQPFDLKALYKLINYLKENNVNLVCSHGYKSTVMGYLVKKMTGLPVIGFSRGFTSENSKVAFYEMLDRKALKHLDGIISVSKSQKDKLEKYGVLHNRNWIVYNAVSTDNHFSINFSEIKKSIFEKLNLPKKARLIVTAGRISPEKGHKFLVDAIPMVITKYPDAHFIFCGDGGWMNELIRQAEQLHIQQNCHFVGFRRDLPDIFRIMEFQVLPSLTEGLPNVVLEGFACSKTVVATAVGGVPEIVVDRKNGILVPPGDSEKLANAIVKLLDNPESSRKMGMEGYYTVRSDYTFEKQTDKLIDIYQDILSG